IPLGVVPGLRHRLFDRAHSLRAAIVGEPAPAMATAGAASEPYPEEFELPPSPVSPATAPSPAPSPVPPAAAPPAAAPRAGEAAPPGARSRPRLVPQGGEGARKAPPLVREAPSPVPPAAAPEAPDDGLPYRQGEIEGQAYELVLKSQKTLAAMVAGDQPGLDFKGWEAAHRGEDLYWVRVRFDGPDGPEEYIWQVRLSLGEITPLSFNARSLF
ncbi:MAG: hypothetical protein JXP48_13280, partial [Acidobacteria bacterium]|nr:hypothetical protein [Acidobacteriota bacterium]